MTFRLTKVRLAQPPTACLVLYAVAMLMHRFAAEWKGVPGEYAGIKYEYRTHEGKTGRQIKVGMESPYAMTL